MKLEIKKLPDSEVEISGEIPAEKFGVSWGRAVKEISSRTEIPGFRKGMTPEKILIEKIGEGEILEEAARLALQEAWPKILEEEKIEALGRPEIVITKLARGNPLGFKIKTAVLPEVKLADYKKIAGEIAARTENVSETSEAEVGRALEYLRKSREKDGLVPEANDEFAKTLGNFENLDGLKKMLGANIKLEKTIKLREKKRMEMLDGIASASEISLPPVLVEAEKEKMLAELKKNLAGLGLEWGHYLGHIKKTEEELGAEWKNEAEQRVRRGLVLREIARVEKIEVSEEELGQEAGGELDQKGNRDYAYGIARNEKVFKLLENGK
ncbi:MAG: trigger factor [bacterium]|nr:trigger factor [bacterium]